MEIVEFHWTASNSLKLYGRHWRVQQPKAVVCLVHGLGEHCQRYDAVAGFFEEHQIALMGFDHQGHGRSAGKRGHSAGGLDSFLDAINDLLRMVKTTYPDVPVFIYSQSMEGNLALNFILRRNPPVQGLIASSPWIRLPKPPSPALLAFAKIARLIVPGFSQPNGLDIAAISRDKSVIEAYRADPLVHGKITVATGLALLNAAKHLDGFSGKMPVPALLLHGGSDRITDPQGSQDFASRVSGEVTFKKWPGLYHELHFEPEREEVLGFILKWIESRI